MIRFTHVSDIQSLSISVHYQANPPLITPSLCCLLLRLKQNKNAGTKPKQWAKIGCKQHLSRYSPLFCFIINKEAPLYMEMSKGQRSNVRIERLLACWSLLCLKESTGQRWSLWGWLWVTMLTKGQVLPSVVYWTSTHSRALCTPCIIGSAVNRPPCMTTVQFCSQRWSEKWVAGKWNGIIDPHIDTLVGQHPRRFLVFNDVLSLWNIN